MRKIITIVFRACVVAVVMTALQGIPPFSLVYGWLLQNHLGFLWWGLVSAVVAICGLLYLRSQNRTANDKTETVKGDQT